MFSPIQLYLVRKKKQSIAALPANALIIWNLGFRVLKTLNPFFKIIGVSNGNTKKLLKNAISKGCISADVYLTKAVINDIDIPEIIMNKQAIKLVGNFLISLFVYVIKLYLTIIKH